VIPVTLKGKILSSKIYWRLGIWEAFMLKNRKKFPGNIVFKWIFPILQLADELTASRTASVAAYVYVRKCSR